jgi:hypothetical protein
MVEANYYEGAKKDAKEAFDRKFQDLMKQFSKRQIAYQGLTLVIEKKLKKICEIIEKFEESEQPKIQTMPVFLQGARFNC